MKCEKCKSEWNSSRSLQVCPFCGESLVQPESKKPEEILCYIVDEYGVEVLQKKKLLLSYFSDFAPHLNKEYKLLKNCCSTDFISILLSSGSSNDSREIAIKKATRLLMDDCFISEEYASTVIEWITYSLGWDNTVSLTVTANTDVLGKKPNLNTAIFLREKISIGYNHAVGVKSNGKVVSIGQNGEGQCNTGNWKNIVSVAAGWEYTIGLKADGKVVAVGNNSDLQCEVKDWNNIIKIIVSGKRTVGLESNGRVHCTGRFRGIDRGIEYLNNVKDVEINGSNIVCILFNGRMKVFGDNSYNQYDAEKWTMIDKISLGLDFIIGLKTDGTVVSAGKNNCGQCNVQRWDNIIQVATGSTHTLGLKSNGEVVATGNNEKGQCNTDNWKSIIYLCADSYYSVGIADTGLAVGNFVTTNQFKDNVLSIVIRKDDYLAITDNGSVNISILKDFVSYNEINNCDWILFNEYSDYEDYSNI